MAQVTIATKKLLKLTRGTRAISGGTGASKTYSIIMILIDYAQTNKNEVIDIVSESFPHLEGGAIEDFKGIMRDRNYWNDDRWNETKHIYTFETETRLKFTSFDKMGKAHGPRRDVLFINECNFIPFNVADQLMTRTRKIVWLDWNPSTDFWFDDEVLGKLKDLDYMGEGGNYPPLVYSDNEALSSAEREKIESHKHNKNWWRVYGLGLKGEIEGLIYSNWKQIDSIPHEARLEKRWLDFGYTNDPSAIGEVYYYNGGWILNELLYRKGMSNKQLADFLNALESPETTVIADSAEPKSIDEISSYGLNIVGCKKGKDSVNTGIQLVQDQPITVTKHSINIIKEQRGYMWATDKNGKVLNEEDPACANHHMSGVRYALGTLGRIKQEETYWDRMFKDELHPEKIQFNKGK